MTMGLAISVNAYLVSYTNANLFMNQLGLQPGLESSDGDHLTLTGITATNISASSTPVLFNLLSSFAFQANKNGNACWAASSLPNYQARWNMFVNSVNGCSTKMIGRDFKMWIGPYYDAMTLYAAGPFYFDLGSGESLQVDLIGQTFQNDKGPVSDCNGAYYIHANLQVVTTPIPAAVWLLGIGLVALITIRRLKNI